MPSLNMTITALVGVISMRSQSVWKVAGLKSPARSSIAGVSLVFRGGFAPPVFISRVSQTAGGNLPQYIYSARRG